MYIHSENVIEIVKSAISKNKEITDNLYDSYTALKNEGIINEQE